MLVATSETRIGNAGVRSTLLLERAVRATVIERERLAFDTRYAASSPGRVEKAGHVFMVAAGRVTPRDGASLTAPVAFVLGDDEIERVGPTSHTFRTDGEHVHVVHLRLAVDQLRVPIGLARGPIALPPACWDAAAHLFREPTALAELLDALASAGASRVGIAVQDEPERFRRLWSALEPLYAAHGGTASIKQIAASLGMSMRQVGRDAKELAAAFGLGTSYRDTLLVLRLRVAVLLLGSPDVNVGDVAEAVGYGSPIAMARAFRDAKLPAPSVIQAALRDESGQSAASTDLR